MLVKEMNYYQNKSMGKSENKSPISEKEDLDIEVRSNEIEWRPVSKELISDLIRM